MLTFSSLRKNNTNKRRKKHRTTRRTRRYKKKKIKTQTEAQLVSRSCNALRGARLFVFRSSPCLLDNPTRQARIIALTKRRTWSALPCYHIAAMVHTFKLLASASSSRPCQVCHDFDTVVDDKVHRFKALTSLLPEPTFASCDDQ